MKGPKTFSLRMNNGNVATITQDDNGFYYGEIRNEDDEFECGCTRSINNDVHKWIWDNDIPCIIT